MISHDICIPMPMECNARNIWVNLTTSKLKILSKLKQIEALTPCLVMFDKQSQ